MRSSETNLHGLGQVGDSDVALLVFVDGVEPLDVLRHLVLRQVDRNVFARGPVHVLPHLGLEEVDGFFQLSLLLSRRPLQLLQQTR